MPRVGEDYCHAFHSQRWCRQKGIPVPQENLCGTMHMWRRRYCYAKYSALGVMLQNICVCLWRYRFAPFRSAKTTSVGDGKGWRFSVIWLLRNILRVINTKD